DSLAIGIRDDGPVLDEELLEILEIDHLLADVANPDDQRDRFAVAVCPFLAGAEAQTPLQATNFLAPCGHGFLVLLLLLLLFRCRFHRFLRSRLVVVLPRRNCGKPEALDAVPEGWIVEEPIRRTAAEGHVEPAAAPNHPIPG